MQRPILILARILGLAVLAVQTLAARPGETLEQITQRLGPPDDLTPEHAKWVFRDQTILYVTLAPAGEERVSAQECLVNFREKAVFREATIAGFLHYEGGRGVDWLLSVAMPEVPQPFANVDDDRASTRFSSDGALAAFLIPLDHPQAILVKSLPASLQAEARIRIDDSRASAARAAAKARSKAPSADPGSMAKAASVLRVVAAAGPPPPAPDATVPPPPPAAGPVSPPPPWHWLEVDSDLKADPHVTRGRLPNGVRYVILPNAEPKGRISLRLLVAAGSLQERDDERGLAHFVEHMLFQGTKSHPNGTLTRELEQLGLGMGPDNTAFTTPDHTIFHLELPNTDETVLHRCLQALREYAGEATFPPDLIEKERGVVLSEMASRADSGFYAGSANTAFLFPRSRWVNRLPIGLADTIRGCTREQLVAFYRAWYRPERLAVIVVGNVAADRAEALVAEVFGSLAPQGPPRDEPADLVPPQASPSGVVVYTDPTQNGVALLFENPRPFPRQPDRQPRRIEDLAQTLAFAMFQTRLEKYSSQFPGSFVGPHAGVDYNVIGWRTAYCSAGGRINDWHEMIVALEQEHRRALEQGFTDAELRIARSSYVNGMDEAVRVVATRPSSWLADILAGSLLYGRVFATPETARDDLAAALAAMTAQDCSTAFRQAWTLAAPHVFLSAHPAFPQKADQISAVLNQSRQQATQDLTRPATAEFAYTDFGPAGTLARDEHFPDLDVHLAEFANGVRFNFKPTAFVADWVQIRVRVGIGKLAQLPSQPGLDLLAGFALPAGGLGKHTRQDLDDLLAGHSLEVQFHVESDACVFDGQCARRDLPMALQLIGAYLTDAAFRPEAMDEVRAKLSSMYVGLAESAGCPITAQAGRLLAGGDRRFGMPEPDELFAHSMAAVGRWLGPQFKTGPIEMSVVGDISWEQARDAVARTIGALPPREPRPDPAAGAAVRCDVRPVAPYFYVTPPTMRQIALAWAWPVSDIMDTHQRRRCTLLGAALAERFRVRLRDQLGASYAPSARFYHHPGFPAYNYFLVYAEVLPAHAAQAEQLAREEISRLRQSPLSAEEFGRIKQPFLRDLDDEIRTNAYWCSTVLCDAQQRPDSLANARDRNADYATITPAELQALARRYLDPNRIFIFVAQPAKNPGN